ncbi:MAG: UDP-3-O-(3-hydroxymyristoyl)glucosamine N-acyltransferase [Bacteroidota bacterium]
MKFTAKQIAELLKGTVDGDSNASVHTLSKIEEGKAGSLSFLANPAYTQYIYTTDASIVIVNNDFVPETTVKCTLVRVENSYMAFASLLEIYNQIKLNKVGISKQSFISETASVGENCYVGEFAFIGENVKLGNNVKIYPQCYVGDNVTIANGTTLFSGVKIYSENVIGANCTIHAGAVIGADGFGFAPQQDANYKKVAQIGNVVIEDNVEIGANTAIDRATLGSTIIRKGVKLDNLIQVAHNVEIGENTVMAAQSGVAGSSKIGKNCMIGGQVGIVGHLTVADNVKVAAQSGIGSNVAENEIMQGSPAFNVSEYRRVYVHFRNLSKLAKRIDELEKQLKAKI